MQAANLRWRSSAFDTIAGTSRFSSVTVRYSRSRRLEFRFAKRTYATTPQQFAAKFSGPSLRVLRVLRGGRSGPDIETGFTTKDTKSTKGNRPGIPFRKRHLRLNIITIYGEFALHSDTHAQRSGSVCGGSVSTTTIPFRKMIRTIEISSCYGKSIASPDRPAIGPMAAFAGWVVLIDQAVFMDFSNHAGVSINGRSQGFTDRANVYINSYIR